MQDLITNDIPPISQETIECDLRAFTIWLNNLAERVNYVAHVYGDLKDQVEQNTYDINALKNRMTSAENNITNLDGRVTTLEQEIAELIGGGGTITELINLLNGRVDQLYGWLPVPYGTIDGRGWKFAMGNISVMSANNGTASISGPGIFTAGDIENNDIYFN